MRTLKVVAALLFCLVVPSLGLAQHVHHQAAVIDGRENAAAISDLTMLRMFFVQATQVYTEKPDDRRLSDRLASIGINGAERLHAILVLKQFRQAYSEWVRVYRDAPVDQKALTQRDAIVRETYQRLSSTLSPFTLAQFDDYIRGEKVHVVLVRPNEKETKSEKTCSVFDVGRFCSKGARSNRKRND